MLMLIVICVVTPALVVMVHYEFLYQMTLFIARLKVRHRFRIVIGVFGALVAHTVEIILFALAYQLMHVLNAGRLSGNFDQSLTDSIYFSFTVFTTLGFGDIEPLGDVRFLTGIESLTGLVLITWTASFLFYEMQKHWLAK